MGCQNDCILPQVRCSRGHAGSDSYGLSPAQTFPISLSSRYSTDSHAVPCHRCSIRFSSALSHCSISTVQKRPLARCTVCLPGRAEFASGSWTTATQDMIYEARSYSLLPAVHAPLAGPGRLWHNTCVGSVHNASWDISCRIPGEKLDAL
jgi:hypothetical protein